MSRRRVRPPLVRRWWKSTARSLRARSPDDNGGGLRLAPFCLSACASWRTSSNAEQPMNLTRILRWLFKVETIEMAVIDDIKTQIADVSAKVDTLIAAGSTAGADAGAAAELQAQNAALGDVSVSLQALDAKVTAAIPAPATPAAS